MRRLLSRMINLRMMHTTIVLCEKYETLLDRSPNYQSLCMQGSEPIVRG